MKFLSQSQGLVRRFALLPGLALARVQADVAGAQTKGRLPAHVITEFGQPPDSPAGPLPDRLTDAMQVALVDSLAFSTREQPQSEALAAIVQSGDPRLAWVISDMMRFVSSHPLNTALAGAAADLLGIDPPARNAWEVINGPGLRCWRLWPRGWHTPPEARPQDRPMCWSLEIRN